MVEIIKKDSGDKLFKIINVILIIIITVILLYPMWFVLVASLSDPTKIFDVPLLLLPQNFTLAGYKLVFNNKDIWIGMRNSIFYTVAGTFLSLALTILIAYPLSRKRFRGKSFFTFFITFTMFFSGGMIPTYLLNQTLGIVDTPFVMVISGAISVYNVIIMRTFFQQNIPEELEESAYLDGASDLQMLIRVVLPLSAPIIAVMSMFYGLGRWNNYFDGLIYISNRSLFPLQLILREILIKNDMVSNNSAMVADNAVYELNKVKDSIKYAAVVVSTVPIFLLYPITSKYFEKGILMGSIKG